MQNKTGNKVRLGVFVTTSVALFIIGIYFIGQKQQLFNHTFRISAIFKGINGLQIGNNVRYSGINVGVVTDIEQISDSTVWVDMQIDEYTRQFIKKNAKAIISSDGLIGNKIISIIPGVPGKPEVVNNDIIETIQPVNMDDVLLGVKKTTDNIANMSGDLAAIMKKIHEGKGTIGQLLMDTSLANNVGQAMINIKEGAGGFKRNMDAASHNFLLKGYFKKQQKEAEKKKKEDQK